MSNKAPEKEYLVIPKWVHETRLLSPQLHSFIGQKYNYINLSRIIRNSTICVFKNNEGEFVCKLWILFLFTALLSFGSNQVDADVFMHTDKTGRIFYRDCVGGARGNYKQISRNGTGKTPEDRLKIAKNGNAKAQYEVGCSIINDYHLAFTWFQRASFGGHVLAQKQLGDMYAYGRGVARNEVMAAKWYRAAESQNPKDLAKAIRDAEYAHFKKIPDQQTPMPSQMPWETNYWECILDEMPGVKTKTVAYSVRKKCNQYSKHYKIKKKSSFFGIKNASECVIEYAKDTPSSLAARIIRQACNKLYVP